MSQLLLPAPQRNSAQGVDPQLRQVGRQIPASDDVDLYALLRDCRARVWEAFFYNGPSAALEAVVLGSLDLAPFVAENQCTHGAAWDMLQAVSGNLGLVRIFGQDTVQEAICTGPRLYEASRLHVRAAA